MMIKKIFIIGLLTIPAMAQESPREPWYNYYKPIYFFTSLLETPEAIGEKFVKAVERGNIQEVNRLWTGAPELEYKKQALLIALRNKNLAPLVPILLDDCYLRNSVNGQIIGSTELLEKAKVSDLSRVKDALNRGADATATAHRISFETPEKFCEKPASFTFETFSALNETKDITIQQLLWRSMQNKGKDILHDQLMLLQPLERRARFISSFPQTEATAILALLTPEEQKELEPLLKAAITEKQQTVEQQLIAAVERQHLDELRTILAQNPSAQEKAAALRLAASKGFDEMVTELLKLDAASIINIPNEHGMTALMLASYRGNANTVKLLLDYNPTLTIQNKQQKTAFDLARNDAIFELLRKAQEHASSYQVTPKPGPKEESKVNARE